MALQNFSYKIKAAARHTAPLALSLLFIWLLRDQLPGIDVQAIISLLQEFEAYRWLLAAIFTALSLIAVGFYDVTAARLMRLPVTDAAAFAAGWRATAIAQTLGFGLVTGSLVRWRLLHLPGKDGLWTATKMTSLVTASYFYGWFIVAGFAATLSPGLPNQIWWLGLLALWIGLAAAVLSLRASPYRLKPYPPVILLARVSGLSLVDTLAASVVIFCFLPEGYMPFAPFYMSFLIAYSLGMLSGVPGGVGPFEMCLLALLAPTDPTPLLAALLGYRAVYFLAPAAFAGISLIAPAKPVKLVMSAAPTSPPPSWPAESALVGQGALDRIVYASSGGLACETHNSEIYLRNPVGAHVSTFLSERRQAARKHGRRLVLYKCTESVAAQARKAGLWSIPIASEATLDPATFNVGGKLFSQLRRKLRKAAKAGVTFASGAPRLIEMEDIDRKWQARSGRARGFSVGQFCPNLVRKQASFTATQDGTPIAFITCHISADRWVLDLMRSTQNCPDGTMQGLVIEAISAANEANVAEFSLCSVPFFSPSIGPDLTSRALARAFKSSASAKGLWRFKSGFAPEWRREYIAFDGAFAVVLGIYDLIQLISTPTPVPKFEPAEQTHDHYDHYEFASASKK